MSNTSGNTAAAARKRPRAQDDDGGGGRGEGEGGTPGKITKPSSSKDEKQSATLWAEQRPVCRVYIVEKKLSSGRLSHLRGIAQKKGIPLADIIR